MLTTIDSVANQAKHLTPTGQLVCTNLGIVSYPQASALQKKLELARIEGEIPDQLLLLEHPPTYTRGRRASASELPFEASFYSQRGIKIYKTKRGGRVTCHGPGQLVAYPIVDLKPLDNDIHRYIRLLEATVIAALAEFGVSAETVEGLTGVWLEGRKIASLGIHVSHGVTTHGFAVNVNNDLAPFEWIVPCGIEGCRVTSIAAETGQQADMSRLRSIVARQFARLWGGTLDFAQPQKRPFVETHQLGEQAA